MGLAARAIGGAGPGGGMGVYNGMSRGCGNTLSVPTQGVVKIMPQRSLNGDIGGGGGC
jgi:hypothetical protein